MPPKPDYLHELQSIPHRTQNGRWNVVNLSNGLHFEEVSQPAATTAKLDDGFTIDDKKTALFSNCNLFYRPAILLVGVNRVLRYRLTDNIEMLR